MFLGSCELVSIYPALVHVFHNRGDSGYGGFPPPFPPSFHCLAHCGGCLLSSLSHGGSWSPALPEFASHGSSLLLGAARLPIVKAPGCLRHQTSTSQVIIFLKLATIIYHCWKLILFLFASSSLCCQFISVNFNFCLFQFNRR